MTSTYSTTSVPMVPERDELVIRATRGWIGIDWRELVRYRELLWFLVWRDLKVRYKQTALGAAWAVLQPIVNLAVFTVVFGILAGIKTEDYPYAVYTFAGLLPWQFFSNGVTTAGVSLLNQTHVITKVYFPRLFVPMATIGVGLVDLALASLVYAALLVFYQQPVSWQIVYLPLLVAQTVLVTLGLGYLLSAVSVRYRDVRFVIPFMIQVLLFVSPVVYPVTLVPERYHALLALNPMTGLIDGYRSAILGKPWNLTTLIVSAVVTLSLLAGGLLCFRRMEREFADIV